MPAGKPRKPTELLKLNGGYRKDRHSNRGDSSLIALPKDTVINPPSKYDAATKKAWKSIVPSLILQGILAEEDFPQLEMLFNSYAEYNKAIKAIADFDKDHPTLTSSDITDRKKLAAWLNESITTFSKLGAKFGLSPVDRTRIITQKEGQQVQDPLEIILAE